MAKRFRKRERSGDRFKSFLLEILVVFFVVIMVMTAILDFVVLELSGRALQSNASNLIAANSRQIQLNINSYLERTETIATLLFSDEAYYQYDASDPSLSDYDKIKAEEVIVNRIVDIGLMENYSDFGIIFKGDHKVGWISHGTEDIFPDGGFYDTFSSYITNPRKKDGWCFGVNGCTDRIYYVKRLNPNAVLISAIYTRELSSVFIYPEQLEDMTIRLVDEGDVILFSSDSDEIGKKLPEEIVSGIATKNKDYIINTNTCSNNWRVICSIPTESILRENTRLRLITLLISAVMAALVLLVGLFLIRKLSKPMDGMVTSLQEKAEIDRLSGVMNKSTFQEMTEDKLEQARAEQSDTLQSESGADKADASLEKRTHVFVMLDVDNFKQVNDQLGHSYGDQVIIRVGKLLRRLYDAETLIGRLGGDEFALYTECVGVDKKEVMRAAAEQMDQVLSAFGREFAHEREICGISLSAGVHVTDKKDVTFAMLYEAGDAALYTSKNEGKDRFTLTEGGEG